MPTGCGSRTPTPSPIATTRATPTPTDGIAVCPQDVKKCSDGTFVGRDPS